MEREMSWWHRIEEKLDRIELVVNAINAVLPTLVKGQTQMAGELDALTTQVAANTTVEQSAVTLIQGIAAQLAAAGTDPAKLAALSASLKTSADALAAAVTANTPAA